MLTRINVITGDCFHVKNVWAYGIPHALLTISSSTVCGKNRCTSIRLWPHKGPKHVTSIWNSCYHYLRNVQTIQSYLTVTSAKTIVHSVISAKLDYCNSLFINIPDYLVAKLQCVHNAVARIVLNLKKYDSVTRHPHRTALATY